MKFQLNIYLWYLQTLLLGMWDVVCGCGSGYEGTEMLQLDHDVIVKGAKRWLKQSKMLKREKIDVGKTDSGGGLKGTEFKFCGGSALSPPPSWLRY